MKYFIADKLEGEAQMKISELYVDGFKNIRGCKIILDGISAILATNDYGKSNLLEAIELGINFVHQSTEAKLRTMSNQNYIPKNRSYRIDRFTFEMTGECKFNNTNYLVKYRFSWNWRTADSLPQILTEELKVKVIHKKSRFYNIISRDKLDANIRKTATARCNKKVAINNSELVLNKLLAWDDYYFLPIIKQVNATEAFYEHQLNPDSPYNTPFIMMKGQQDFIELSTADEDMGKTLNYLKNNWPNEYHKIQDAFSILFPELDDIHIVERKIEEYDQIRESLPELDTITLAETEYRVFFYTKNFDSPIPIDYLSAGTKRVLLLLTMVVLANIRGLSLVEIEEAENHIHPKLLSSLLDILETLRGECNILISSHSPYMTQFIAANKIYVGIYSPNAIANFKKISNSGSKNIYKRAEEEGVSASEYIFNLLCDETDQQLSLFALTEE